MERFNRTIRGYDPDEVNEFLDKVINKVEEMVNEAKVKDEQLEEYRKRTADYESLQQK